MEVIERDLHLSRLVTCQENLPMMDCIEPDVVRTNISTVTQSQLFADARCSQVLAATPLPFALMHAARDLFNNSNESCISLSMEDTAAFGKI